MFNNQQIQGIFTGEQIRRMREKLAESSAPFESDIDREARALGIIAEEDHHQQADRRPGCTPDAVPADFRQRGEA